MLVKYAINVVNVFVNITLIAGPVFIDVYGGFTHLFKRSHQKNKPQV